MEGEVLVQRDGETLSCKKGGKINWGDQVELHPESTLTLAGPSGLRCKLTDSASMAWRAGGVMLLKRGTAKVVAPNRKAIQELKLSTPDGDVQPDNDAKQLEFEVKVGEDARPEDPGTIVGKDLGK